MKQAIRAVFTRLSDESIPYCLLRQFDAVREGSVDGDIDVLVRREDRADIDRVLSELGFHARDGDTSEQTIYRRFISEQRDWVHFDLYWDAPTYNGIPFLDGERTLAGRRRYRELWVPAPEDYVVELAFHTVLNKNRVRDEYRREIEQWCGEIDREKAAAHARSLFGTAGVTTLTHICNGEYDRAVEMKRSLLTAGIRRHPERVPLLVWNLVVRRELLGPLLEFGSRLRSRVSRPAVVAVLGPDGSGKTTVTTTLQSVLCENSFDARRHELGVYNNDTLLMRLVKRFVSARETSTTGSSGGTETDDARSVDAVSTDKETLAAPGGMVHAAVHLADISLRQLKAELSGADIVIADRYAHDVLLYDDPGPLAPLLRLFERRPFHGVVLAGDVETIAARSEYDEASVRTMLRRLDSVEFVRVDTGQPVDVIVTRILEELSEKKSIVI